MSRDILRQAITVATFIATVAINAAANIVPINDQQTGEISDRFEVYVIPAGYVFSIWSVIYLGLLAFTIYQALPGRRADPVLRSLGYLPALTGVLNTAWLLLWHYELFALTVPVMLLLLGTLIAIHLRLWERRDAVRGVPFWVIRVPFSIYLGWITVATIANIAQTSAALGFEGFGLPAPLIGAAVLVVGLAIAVTFVLRYRDIAYGLVIVWAYAGIVVKELDTLLVAVVAGGSAVLVGVSIAAAIVAGGGRPLPGSATR
jgi:hypothetical protein